MNRSTKLIIAGATAGVAIVSGAFIVRHCINVDKENSSVHIVGGSDVAYSFVNERGEYIGQDKEVVGYYRRIGIAKANETYEEMLELRGVEGQGYLVANDDGTAFFELDGEKTEYTFDKKNFYLKDDTEKVNGYAYTYIGGRLIISDGTTVTQYLRLTDAELAEYPESNK